MGLLETESRSRAHSASLEASADGLDTPVTPSSPARSAGVLDDAIHVERGGSDTVTLQYVKPSHISEEYGKRKAEQPRINGLYDVRLVI